MNEFNVRGMVYSIIFILGMLFILKFEKQIIVQYILVGIVFWWLLVFGVKQEEQGEMNGNE